MSHTFAILVLLAFAVQYVPLLLVLSPFVVIVLLRLNPELFVTAWPLLFPVIAVGLVCRAFQWANEPIHKLPPRSLRKIEDARGINKWLLSFTKQPAVKR